MKDKQYFLGLMSGTSLDGLDVALVTIDHLGAIALVDYACFGLPDEQKRQLAQLSLAQQSEVDTIGHLAIELAKFSAHACLSLLANNQVSADKVTAIGCHGVTIRHRPQHQHAFSWQLTDPNTLAALTQIDVIADFRGMDMAVKGQGAPLVPKFHQAVWAQYQQSKPTHLAQDAIIVNLGGIANISVLSQRLGVLGYDTGPANTLMDLWCQRHTGNSYDHGGTWAASGQEQPALLSAMLAEPYFALPYPKSTGKETFNASWLESHLNDFEHSFAEQDVQATLLALTAHSLADQLALFNISNIYLCGGGAENSTLVAKLQQLLPHCRLSSSQELGIAADSMEAMAFAWLAYCRVNRLPANVPSVTGANKAVVLGAWYSAYAEDLA